MDFGGVVGLDGNGGVGGGIFSSPLTSSDVELSRQRGIFGSGHLKHGRSGGQEENEWRCIKVGRSENLLAAPNKAASSLLRSNSHTLFPDGEQMLCFSSSKADAMLLPTNAALPYYYNPSSSPSFTRNAGLVSGCSNGGMHGVLGVRGPFTPSQYMELENQTLVYRCIDSNVPIPPSLLISIRRGINQSGFSASSFGSYRSNAMGWGSFNLGFSGNVDSEPGRCRRTDGKKWRCSRDAVADQKYCERHMNRGRHRSRKHVEGQSGHAAKAIPLIAPSQSASAVSSNSQITEQQQLKSLQPNVTDSSHAQYNRMPVSKENANGHVGDSQGLSMLTALNSKFMNTIFPVYKHPNSYEASSSGTDFGLISTDPLICFDRHRPSRPLQHFIDDWPRDQSDRSTATWPEDKQSDKTQLSISIPMASSDFSSSSSSPNPEKLSLSPLRLSRELDPIHMSLGVGVMIDENQRQACWVPISWESSLGGPLGEVLANTNSTPREHSKNGSSSSLNLLTDGWDSSPRMRSSPTFGSLSSSTGSSPRAENLLGSTLVNTPIVPLL